MKCIDCMYFDSTHPGPDLIPSMHWLNGEVQDVTVIEYEHEGECTNEANWKPSRGNMPCDRDYHCSHFIHQNNKVVL